MTAGSRSSPTFSVVVCTRNRPQQLDQCLAGLARLDYPNYEVVVVDNAPENHSAREVAERWGVRYVIEPVPGLSRARNRGAYSCAADIVAYIDDDAVADSSWLRALAHNFEDPRVGAVTGAILPSQPAEERAGGHIGDEAGARPQRRVVDSATPGWFEITNFGDIGDGSNMAFRRSVFDIWTGFDERLGRGTILSGGEEHYAFFNLVELGFRMVYDPDAVIRHPSAPSFLELRSRHLNLLSISAAYMTRLAVEHPSSRKALRQFIGDRVRGTRQPWTSRAANGASPIAPRWRSLLALLAGPWIYLQSRLATTPETKPGSEPAETFSNGAVTASTLRDQPHT